MTLAPWLRGHLAMLTFSALIAGSFSLGGMVANEIAPGVINAVRFVLAACLMGSLALLTGGFKRSDFVAPWRYLILGCLFSAYFVLMFEGLKTAAPVSTAAVFTLTPAMAAVFGWLMMRQITTPWIAFTLAVGGVGALWVIFRADLAAFLAFEVGRGEATFFIGCIFHAAFTPALRFLNRGERSIVYTFLFMSAGALVLLVWSGPDLVATDWVALPWLVWVAIGYLAIFASAASFFCLQFAARVLPSSKVMAYSYLTPTWVICWELALGHGAPPVLILIGVAVTILALLMLLRDD